MQMTLLEYLAENAGLYGRLETSTSAIAEFLETSQQTVSRKLIDFEEQGLIERELTARGISLRFADGGRALLEEKYTLLRSVFLKGNVVAGRLVTGLGEGAYYVGQPGYQIQFISKLGFKAFPGTLNLRITEKELGKIAGREKIEIAGFSRKERSFGGLTCYKGVLNRQEVAIAIPDRTAHSSDTLEVIAPVDLRKKFSLKDGNVVRVKLQ